MERASEVINANFLMWYVIYKIIPFYVEIKYPDKC
jgi:hypothetical protein